MLLLEQFENLTLHPKNAARLKELVLQLAVQGKLTENWRRQNPAVEPAAELLKRIEAEKAQLVKEKKIRKEQPLEPVNPEEINYGLPDTWAWVRLGELGDWGAGATPSRGNSELYGGDINWYKSGELNNRIIDYSSEESITPLALQKTSLRLNKPGDVLIAMYGATIGKTAILAVEGTTNQAVCACTCYTGFNNLYLHLLLKAYKSVFTDQGTGGAQPNISRVKIRTTPVPLPPFSEQEAIVARVEELMQKIEELEKQTAERIQLKQHLGAAALQQLTAAVDEELEQNWLFLKQHFQTIFDESVNVKKLRETILQLAVQGKLTATWRKCNPTTEPASELLKRIEAEKAQLVKEKKIKKEKPLEPISEDEVPYTLPKGWAWCRLGEISRILNGRAYKQEELLDTGTPVLRVGNLFTSNKWYYSDLELEADKYCTPGDLLYAWSASFGPFIWEGSKAIFHYHIWRMDHSQHLNKKYFYYFLLNETERIKASGHGVSMVHMTKQKMEVLHVSLPPLTEQEVIVAKVDQLMQLCDGLEQQIQQSRHETETLMQAVVREALQVQEEEVPESGLARPLIQ